MLKDNAKKIVLFTNYNHYDEDDYKDLEGTEDEYTREMFENDQNYEWHWFSRNVEELPDDECIAIAKLRLWYGKRTAYKDVKLNQFTSILSDCEEYCEFSVEDKEMRITGAHHDGTNHYLIRQWKKKLSKKQKDIFRNYLYDLDGDKEIDKDILNQYTIRVGNKVLKKINGI